MTGGARPAFIDVLFAQVSKPIYIISPNLLQAQKMVEELSNLIGEEFVHYYPADEFIAADMAIASPELRAERIATLDHLVRGEKGVYVIPVAGMRKMMTPRSIWESAFLETALGQQIEIDRWLQQLIVMGYVRSQMVTSPGEFALRGGILDIYPPYLDAPIRIELFDSEVDSIRTFSADDQRSIQKLEQVRILPAVELVLTMEQCQIVAERLELALAKSLKKVSKQETKDLLYQHIKQDIDMLHQGHIPTYVNKHGSLLYDGTHFRLFYKRWYCVV